MRILPLLFLAVTGCATDEMLDTDEVALESSVYQWTAPSAVPNQSSEYQPGLTFFGGRLHMVHNGSSNPQELWWSRYNGSSWSTNVKLSHTATGGPALAVYNNRIAMIYRQYGQNRLMMAIGNGTDTFGTPVTAGAGLGTESLVAEPAAATFNGDLFIAYCTTGAVRVDRYNGSTWTQVLRRVPGVPCRQVELAVLPFEGLYLVYMTESSGTLGTVLGMYDALSTNGSTWSASTYVPDKLTKNPISIVICNNTTHMVHGGHQYRDDIWWSERVGGSWGPDYLVPYNRSQGGAGLGCFTDTRAIMVHNQGANLGNGLSQSEFGP